MFNPLKRTSFIIILLILWMVIFTTFSYAQDLESKELIWAQRFFDEGNYEASLELLKGFLSDNENNREIMKNGFCKAYYLLSKIYFYTEEYGNMEKNLEELFKLNLDYEFSEDEDVDFLQRALMIKEKVERMITIVLKDGKEIKGKFISENVDSVTIETDFGTETIKKIYVHETIPRLEIFQIKKEVKKTPEKMEIKKEEKPSTTEKEIVQKPIKPVTVTKPRKAKLPSSEFTISMGYRLGYSVNETTTYSDSFSAGSLESATSIGTLDQKLKKPIGFGGSINYFFAQGIGIQLRLDANSKSNFTDEAKSKYNLTWSWTTRGPYEEDKEWELEGDVSLMVISGNFIYKYQRSGRFAPQISVGISYFTGKAKANTKVGYAATWTYYEYWWLLKRRIDYFDIPAELDASISGIGFNVGGGADILFSPNVALNIDARYFIKSKIEESWQLIPGTYKANMGSEWTFTLDQEDVEEIQKTIDRFEINPSFFKISIGLKIMF